MTAYDSEAYGKPLAPDTTGELGYVRAELAAYRQRAEEAEAALELAEKALKRIAGNDWTPAFIAREALAAIEALKPAMKP